MRTTVNLPDDVLSAVKREAVDRGVPIGTVLETALRRYFAERPAATAALELPTYGGSGLRPGVDLEDKRAVRDLLDAPA